VIARGWRAQLSGEQLRALAEEQAALRRVATLVAHGTPTDEVFAAVVEEVGRLFGVDLASMCRYDSGRILTWVAAWGKAHEYFPVGTRRMLGGRNLGTIVFGTGRSARIDNYADSSSGPIGIVAGEAGINSSLAAPIMVEGRLWGVIAAGSIRNQPLPEDTEARLASFTELVATAIVNAENRAGLVRLAEEQAGLRRVATLVARGTPPEAVFAAVVEEVGRLVPVEFAGMSRFEPDGKTFTVVATSSAVDESFPDGGRWSLGGKNVATLVLETGRAARIDNYADVSGQIGVAGRKEGIGSAVAAPIIVEGRLWGVTTARTRPGLPLPADAEARLANFTELVATAIANAQGRAELVASRARIVAAADETRRQIERDLHDGIQQRLVSLGLELRAAQATVSPRLGDLRHALSGVAEGLASVFDELREISHGIHPAILSEGGLEPALRALRRRSAVPVELDLHLVRRMPASVEVAAYYAVCEGLTNAAKHALASVVNVKLDTYDAVLRLTIRDDGIGGADAGQGSGLLGLGDRIAALGGRFEVTSPVGKGTVLLIEVPLDNQSSTMSTEP
jgi:signal transduction histidine kinase